MLLELGVVKEFERQDPTYQPTDGHRVREEVGCIDVPHLKKICFQSNTIGSFGHILTTNGIDGSLGGLRRDKAIAPDDNFVQKKA